MAEQLSLLTRKSRERSTNETPASRGESMSNDPVKNLNEWDYECGRCHRRGNAHVASVEGWKRIELPIVKRDASGRLYSEAVEIWICSRCSFEFPTSEQEWLNQ
jgi:hypothetical protein